MKGIFGDISNFKINFGDISNLPEILFVKVIEAGEELLTMKFPSSLVINPDLALSV